MTQLPALVTRPLVDAYADALAPRAVPDAAAPSGTVLSSLLTDGVPLRLALDAARSLVLAVPLGVAKVFLDADPLTVVWDDAWANALAVDARMPVDLPRPRLTLVVDERVADSVTVVARTPLLLGDGGRAVVEVVVDRLVLTAGSLRGPGRFSSSITLRWRDLLAAGDAGPVPTAGDTAVDLVRRVTR